MLEVKQELNVNGVIEEIADYGYANSGTIKEILNTQSQQISDGKLVDVHGVKL